ncbi:DinB family protein [Neobacillus sp. LXY-1]|uniref:DinB family protein n=1 Tax=Neobacillus sp. LXY-1 TaxID=3379133 RepID=UPI003EE296EF
MLQRPNENEYPEYYVPYVNLVRDGDLITILKENRSQVSELFHSLSDEDGQYRYAQGKWSIKEVLGHMSDTERVMSYRLLRIGRGDQTPLAGFNEEYFVNGSQVNDFPIKSILNEFISVRTATISLIENMPKSVWENVGNANNLPVTARAVAYILAGHEIHHRNIITEKYLPNIK